MINASPLQFADATAEFTDSDFVILGVPFDATSTYRPGARFAPNAIRTASSNFEKYVMEYDVDFDDIKLCDLGDLDEYGTVDQLNAELTATVKMILERNAFPILIGGEHSLTPGAITAVQEHFGKIGVITIDAHLDFRDEYLGVKYSHACTTRNICEVVGVDKVVAYAIRSYSREEKDAVERLNLKYLDIFKIRELGVERTINQVIEWLDTESIYLTLDIDAIDPAYAPASGTPEPFGLTPLELKRCIELVSSRLIAIDLVEVSPPYDPTGITVNLAAKIIRDVIALKSKHYCHHHRQ
jgi:agmatinase